MKAAQWLVIFLFLSPQAHAPRPQVAWKYDLVAEKWVPAPWTPPTTNHGINNVDLMLTRREAPLHDHCKKSVLAVGSQQTVFHMGSEGGNWERFFNGNEWLYQSHDAPQSRVFLTCTAAREHFQLAGPLFCIDEEGVLFQRMGHDIKTFSWVAHIPPPPLKLIGMGSFTGDFSLLVTSTDGQLIEREYGSVVHWNYNTFQWFNHGSPENTFLTTVIDARSDRSYVYFCLSDQGLLWEGNLVSRNWTAHGCPVGERLSQGPAVVFRTDKGEVSSIFLRTEFGNLVERLWNTEQGRWEWIPHGHPPSAVLLGTPGGYLQGNTSIFISTAGGKVSERRLDGREWSWVSHGRPEKEGGRVSCDRPVAINSSSIVFLLEDRRLAERVLSENGKWEWRVHGTPGNGGKVCEGQSCVRKKLDGFYFLDEASLQSKLDKGSDNFIYALAFHGPVCRRNPMAVLSANSTWMLSRSGRLLERHYNENGWIYHPHTSPGGVRLQSVSISPTGALFSVDEQGVLFQRTRAETQFWWVPHVRADVQLTPAIQFSPDENILFVATEDGRLFQRTFANSGWNNENFEWYDHGKPNGVVLTSVVDAGVLRINNVFAVSVDGQLFQYSLDTTEWIPHGAPGTDTISNSGAAVFSPKGNREGASLFLVTDDGDLIERQWRKVFGQWEWLRHGQPTKGPVLAPPISGGSEIGVANSLFVVLATGRVFERKWDGKHWSWVNHRRPKGISLACDRGVARSNESILFTAEDHRLAERVFEGGKWEWRLHDVPERGSAQTCGDGPKGSGAPCTSGLGKSGMADGVMPGVGPDGALCGGGDGHCTACTSGDCGQAVNILPNPNGIVHGNRLTAEMNAAREKEANARLEREREKAEKDKEAERDGSKKRKRKSK